MSYDYSSESTSLDLVNPYVFQNRILLLCGIVALSTGLYIFFAAQQALQQSLIAKSVLLCSLGIGLTVVAVSFFAKAMQRLKFYFGRDKPASLAPEIPLGATGQSEQAVHLQSLLRQRALAYVEPQGALQGMLYHYCPKLLTAPTLVRQFANEYFSNLCTLIATFLSFLTAWFFAKPGIVETWVSLIYFLLSFFWLIKPYSTIQKKPLTTVHLVVLIVIGMILPTVIGLMETILPILFGLTFHLQIFVLFGCTLLASLLLLSAALGQTTEAPVTQVSNELLRVSMNSSPATLFQEIERIQQLQWTENIPNRCYSRLEPSTSMTHSGGGFSGDLLQESQPMPIQGRNVGDIQSVFADPGRKFLGFSDVFAAFLIGVSVLFLLIFVNTLNIKPIIQPGVNQSNQSNQSIQPVSKAKTAMATNSANAMIKTPTKTDPIVNWATQNWGLLTGALMMMSVALFCLKNAAYLWGRFDFKSNVLWVTLHGNHQTATLGTGNHFNGQFHTENKFVRVEDMTVNIWRTCVESVCFGANSPRQITAMFATQKEVKELTTALLEYVNGQSLLTVPQSERDVYKMSVLFQTEQTLKTGKHTASPFDDRLQDSDTHTATITDPALSINTDLDNNSNSDNRTIVLPDSELEQAVAEFKFCTACGARHLLAAKFCSECGAAV